LRVPFLDHELVEFAFGLPPKDKLHKGTTKYILKKIAGDLIPSVVVHRKKKGFPVPIDHWFRGDLYELSREVLLAPSSYCRDHFDPSYVSSLLDQHKGRKEDFSAGIWNLLVFEYWCKAFIPSSGMRA
jgi:asparagine synthase (glutamine-hydrolysing)